MKQPYLLLFEITTNGSYTEKLIGRIRAGSLDQAILRYKKHAVRLGFTTFKPYALIPGGCYAKGYGKSQTAILVARKLQ